MILFPLIIYITLVITVVIHEFSHAWAADKLGDPTARLSGRLTLDPRPHLDMVGTVLIPIVMLFSGTGMLVGWAKPVPFDPFNLADPRKDAGKIAIAGPLSNFLLAIVVAIVLRFVAPAAPASLALLVFFLEQFVRLNILIGLFNLIPVSPLDGFKVVGALLSEKQANEWYSLERYGIIFLLFLIFPFMGSRSMLSIILEPPFRLFSGLLLP